MARKMANLKPNLAIYPIVSSLLLLCATYSLSNGVGVQAFDEIPHDSFEESAHSSFAAPTGVSSQQMSMQMPMQVPLESTQQSMHQIPVDSMGHSLSSDEISSAKNDEWERKRKLSSYNKRLLAMESLPAESLNDCLRWAHLVEKYERLRADPQQQSVRPNEERKRIECEHMQDSAYNVKNRIDSFREFVNNESNQLEFASELLADYIGLRETNDASLRDEFEALKQSDEKVSATAAALDRLIGSVAASLAHGARHAESHEHSNRLDQLDESIRRLVDQESSLDEDEFERLVGLSGEFERALAGMSIGSGRARYLSGTLDAANAVILHHALRENELEDELEAEAEAEVEARQPMEPSEREWRHNTEPHVDSIQTMAHALSPAHSFAATSVSTGSDFGLDDDDDFDEDEAAQAEAELEAERRDVEDQHRQHMQQQQHLQQQQMQQQQQPQVQQQPQQMQPATPQGAPQLPPLPPTLRRLSEANKAKQASPLSMAITNAFEADAARAVSGVQAMAQVQTSPTTHKQTDVAPRTLNTALDTGFARQIASEQQRVAMQQPSQVASMAAASTNGASASAFATSASNGNANKRSRVRRVLARR